MTRRGRIAGVGAAFRARALALVCAVACLLVSSVASANAPFCDPSGASMSAPVPALPSATGELSAEDCEAAAGAAQADRGVPPRDPSPLLRLWDLPDRVVVTPLTLPTLAGRVLPRAAGEMPVVLPAHAPGVFRPPRA